MHLRTHPPPYLTSRQRTPLLGKWSRWLSQLQGASSTWCTPPPRTWQSPCPPPVSSPWRPRLPSSLGPTLLWSAASGAGHQLHPPPPPPQLLHCLQSKSQSGWSSASVLTILRRPGPLRYLWLYLFFFVYIFSFQGFYRWQWPCSCQKEHKTQEEKKTLSYFQFLLFHFNRR